MKVNDWLRAGTKSLDDAGIGTARLDALVLLEDVTGIDRARLLAEPETKLLSKQVSRLKKLLSLRAQHVPLAYVRGQTEFYGRTFVITPAVLEPRPESETMIDMLKKLSRLPIEPKIADIGGGSGALGITAALELPNSRVILVEIDSEAIKIAKLNVDKFTLNISVIQNDLLEGIDQQFDVILCNLPYVPDDFQINLAAGHEPRLAIFGGPDGLDLYRRLFQQLAERSSQVLYLLTESLPTQHKELEKIAAGSNYELIEKNDFIQAFKRIQ